MKANILGNKFIEFLRANRSDQLHPAAVSISPTAQATATLPIISDSCTTAQPVGHQEDGSNQESEKEREDCQVAVPVMKAFGGKFEYCNSRKILKHLVRLLETNVKRKILSDTSHHEDFTSFDDCRALLFAVAEIRPYAAPHGQVAEYWYQVLTKLQSDGRFPGKKKSF